MEDVDGSVTFYFKISLFPSHRITSSLNGLGCFDELLSNQLRRNYATTSMTQCSRCHINTFTNICLLTAGAGEAVRA